MRSDSGSTTSLWMDTADVPAYPPLTQDAETDVCIVGAGIAGLSIAYELAREGKRVIVLDDGPIGGGETGRTSAHLSFALDDFYSRIAKMHGADGARIAAASHRAAVDEIERIARDEEIDCGFERVDGYWFAETPKDAATFAAEADAARDAGLADVQVLPSVPNVPFASVAAIRFPGLGQFHPLRYVAGLARAIVRYGGRIHCGTHVADFQKRPRRPSVTTEGKQIVTADAIVFATNSPINDWVTMHTKQAAYRTYVVGMRIPRGAVRHGLWWDTLDPYHYVRIAPGAGDEEILIAGGEDHKTGQGDGGDHGERFARLERWARQRFPMAGEAAYRWSGQVLEPTDYMAFIGRNPGDENIYIVTGDSGHGLTHGAIAGLLVSDLILGRDSAWAPLYDPSRKSLRATKDFLRENLNVAAQYRQLLTPGDIASPDDLAAGSGAVMRDGRHKVAVYKDDDGALHMRSAVCPHLFCVVDWNATEKTWDCPCHGSRFDRFGTVVNGPANSDLGELGGE